MKIIFIGGFYPSKFLEKHTHDKLRGFQSAAQNYQSAFISGLIKEYSDVDLISLPFLAAYKGGDEMLNIGNQEFIENRNKVNILGFLNLPGLKNLFRFVKLTFFLLRHFSSLNCLIYVYSTGPVFLLAIRVLKVVNPKIKVCTIVTDLFDYNNTFFKQMISKAYFYGWVQPLTNTSNSFIFLTDKMKEYFAVKPYIVIEGIFNDTVVRPTSDLPSFNIDFSKKIVLYSGTLDEQFGIKTLVEGFLALSNKDISLVICGTGDTHNYLMEICKGTSSVVYLGNLPIETTRVLQSKSYLLVNPRPNIGAYVSLSFPSKTIEYLASGIPSLLHKLDSFPPEYDDYYYRFKGTSIEEVIESLNDVLGKSPIELAEKAKLAREFILREKSPQASVEKANKLNSSNFY